MLKNQWKRKMKIIIKKEKRLCEWWLWFEKWQFFTPFAPFPRYIKITHNKMRGDDVNAYLNVVETFKHFMQRRWQFFSFIFNFSMYTHLIWFFFCFVLVRFEIRFHCWWNWVILYSNSFYSILILFSLLCARALVRVHFYFSFCLFGCYHRDSERDLKCKIKHKKKSFLLISDQMQFFIGFAALVASSLATHTIMLIMNLCIVQLILQRKKETVEIYIICICISQLKLRNLNIHI